MPAVVHQATSRSVFDGSIRNMGAILVAMVGFIDFDPPVTVYFILITIIAISIKYPLLFS